jgi:hypothetical protein
MLSKEEPMQGPRGDEALQGLEYYEWMVGQFAESAKAFWGAWGPMGEPMIQGIDAWVQMQRAYLQWLRQIYGAGNQP